MATVLEKICDTKRAHVERKKQQISITELQEKIKDQPPALDFVARLQTIAGESTALITEVKKASPSKGIIRADFDPLEIAKTYQASGAACLSVLTDEPYFQGHDDYFIAIRKEVSLPMLRKDFMIDPYQIYESRVMGADCILLIMAALSDEEAHELFALSHALGMQCLVEIHDAEECARAVKLSPAMIGVNNRNLKTLDVDVETSLRLASHIPDTVLKISESGISDPATISNLKKSGFSAFLVGESLMKQQDIGQATLTLRTKSV